MTRNVGTMLPSDQEGAEGAVSDQKCIENSVRSNELSDVSASPNFTVASSAPLRGQATLPVTSMDEDRVRPSLPKGTGARLKPAKIFDDLAVMAGYEAVPTIEIDRLPRGGLSLDTKSVGRIQFGIPPETIKDSMLLGISVPSVYIVPVERFCREASPALGINLAEFEFPCYFNYFVRGKRCTLIVDSLDAEKKIRQVFQETLLGPAQFRRKNNPLSHEAEDFHPSFPLERRPNFAKESEWFRRQEATSVYNELCIGMLLEFRHFQPASATDSSSNIYESLGVPPPPPEDGVFFFGFQGDTASMPPSEHLGSQSDESSEGEDSPAERRISELSDKRQSFSVVKTEHSQKRASVLQETIKMRRRMSDSNAMVTRKDEEIFGRLSITKHDDDSEDSSSQGQTQISLPSAATLLGSDEEEEAGNSWTYSQVKWLGDVCTIYPPGVTASNMSARVEIFKMAGGTEYIVHDIDENNYIIGKARFSGTVRVSDTMGVIGFTSGRAESDFDLDFDDDNNDDDQSKLSIPRALPPPTFDPPNFGVTVLGNSHGFDKSGSTSGYVLWINGRGVMIDPPPYSSSTLEREGIRPRMIVAILVTHIHADHDGGAFQKVLTGSRVSVITTPTIYKSFIRKYAALSGLSPSLLRHSHRHRPAIIGQPLQFHGATFHFTYSLHTIPCLAFRVEWGTKSIVFTGDHLNNPPIIDKLESMRVLTKERANDLRNLPLQECDLLLHESGAPPIHTQLDVLLALPESVKQRMYIVHTAALPEGCPLKVAPTGTDGTIRLDLDTDSEGKCVDGPKESSANAANELPWRSGNGDPKALIEVSWSKRSFSDRPRASKKPSKTSVSDAWFVLNLLSDVPFLSSLPYSHTMELLETAQVDAFDAGEVVVPAESRSEVLCVVWEGTCMERKRKADARNRRSLDPTKDLLAIEFGDEEDLAVWHAGDWTGPLSLQPDLWMSGESRSDRTPYDVVAVSMKGVKVITWCMKDMHVILQSGSPLYRKYLADQENLEEKETTEMTVTNNPRQMDSDSDDSSLGLGWQGRVAAATVGLESNNGFICGLSRHPTEISVLQILNYNSALRKLSAVQKRHLESLAEGPIRYDHGQPIWWIGRRVENAYLIVNGTAVFRASSGAKTKMLRRGSTGSIMFTRNQAKRGALFTHLPRDKELKVSPNSEYARLEIYLQDRMKEIEGGAYDIDLSPKEQRVRDSRDRFANKVLGRLYARRNWTAGLAFSRGHFLSDTSRMVSGSLADYDGEVASDNWYGGIQGREPAYHIHSSNLSAGPDGCVVMVFPRKSLISFLDAHPGILLSFLGTQVIV